MYVNPKFRGRGIVHKIIKKFTAWTILQEITELRLEVYQANELAMKAYEKLGFTNHYIQMRKEV